MTVRWLIAARMHSVEMRMKVFSVSAMKATLEMEQTAVSYAIAHFRPIQIIL